MLKSFLNNPAALRVAPLALYLAFTFCQGKFGEESKYWCYLIKTCIAGLFVLSLRGRIPEMRYAFSWASVLVGIGVLFMWVGIDRFYPPIGRTGLPWNPFNAFGDLTTKAWLFFWARACGSTVVVPMVEEVFYRSFLYRYWIKQDFMAVDLRHRDYKAAAVSAVIFGFGHSEWLAGILCGFAYQWLVWRRGRLGDAMFAHAITNAMLAGWVYWKGDWFFW